MGSGFFNGSLDVIRLILRYYKLDLFPILCYNIVVKRSKAKGEINFMDMNMDMIMEMLAIIGLVVFFLLVVCLMALAKTGRSRKYGYVTLPTGSIIEGWVKWYAPEANGMANIRISGRTYYVHCSQIVLIEK